MATFVTGTQNPGVAFDLNTDYEVLVLTAGSTIIGPAHPSTDPIFEMTGSSDFKTIQIDGTGVSPYAGAIEVGLGNLSAQDSEDNMITISASGVLSAWDSVIHDVSYRTVIVNAGSLTAQQSPAILMHGEEGKFHNTGTVIGDMAFSLWNTAQRVLNQGEINGHLHGMILAGSDHQIENMGTISAGRTGIQVGAPIETQNVAVTNAGTISGYTGIELYGTGNQLVSSGVISADHKAVEADGSGYLVTNSGKMTGGAGVAALFGSDYKIVNTGQMTAGEGDAVHLGLNSGVAEFINHGDTYGTVGARVWYYTANPSNAVIRNSGTLHGQYAAVMVHAEDPDQTGSTVVDNRGHIIGRIEFHAGDDMYFGRDGTISGTVLGASGNDILIGGNGHNVFDGGEGNDELRGRAGDDTLVGATGEDTLIGGRGDDEIEGGSGKDTLDGGAGDDLMIGGSEKDVLRGGKGDDTLRGGDGQDDISGNAGDDAIFGGQSADFIRGHQGDDLLRGDEGKDDLRGGTGNDTLAGDQGNDFLRGGDNEDQLNGGDGDDTLLGGRGIDTLYGDAGNDVLKGGDGDDWFYATGGNDELYGGRGADVFVFGSFSEGVDDIHDFEDGVDRIDVSEFGMTIVDFYTTFLPMFSQQAPNWIAVSHTAYGGAAAGALSINGLNLSSLDISDFIL